MSICKQAQRNAPALVSRLLAALLVIALPASHSAAAFAAAPAAPKAPARSAPIHAVEQAWEVPFASLRLSDARAGFLLVTPCARCQPVSLSIDARSLFVLNGQPVALDTLLLRVAQRPPLMATVMYASDGPRLTRLWMRSP